MPRGERGVEVARILDPEVGEPRPDPGLVDDPVAAMAVGQLDVRLERRLDEIRVGARPRDADEHADVAALDEPEPSGATRDLRDLPRQQVAPLLPVELRRLGEEQRLARQVDAVTEHVGGDAHVGAALEEPVDLLAPRRERHRPVEHRYAARVQTVDLARQREHRLAAERDEHLPGASARSWHAPTHSSGSFRSNTLTSTSGNAWRTSGCASSAPSSRTWRYSPARSSRVQAEPRSSSSAHCTSSRTSTSPATAPSRRCSR